MASMENYNGWKLDKSRNPYRGFRYEKNAMAVGTQKINRIYRFFIQELSSGEFQTNFIFYPKQITNKEEALEMTKLTMNKIDRGELGA